jgi:hypothetical protein
MNLKIIIYNIHLTQAMDYIWCSVSDLYK